MPDSSSPAHLSALGACRRAIQAVRPPQCFPRALPPSPSTLLPMNNPITITEPRSFADSLADIRFLQQRVDTATKALLTRHGWRYTRLTPAHRWLWSKKLPGGRTILTDLNPALAIEASLAGQPLPPAAPVTTWHSRACGTDPALAQPPAPSAGTSAA